ncbi:MAG: hypothetical protein IKI61_01370 [Erysipelotrichaceae bacterium]|jgi:uncharacterized membrane protein|nr:hypothetical protein [Erysipelotrichaceae bacterium]MCR5095780.1 hypothetical protein [Erysipelotrichaceae bacterium]
MRTIIYYFIHIITKLHTKLLALANSHGYDFTDKQMHFLVIGVFGFVMMLVIEPIFKWLIKKHGELLITFLYVFTIVVVVSLAIEIGQAYSGTGDMDFYDVASGLLGFFVFFAVYLIGYIIINSVRKPADKQS